jgi:hypothetical protein
MKYNLHRTAGRQITVQDILEDIKRVAGISKSSTLTKKVFSKYASVSVNTIINRFGTWHSALLRAGLGEKSIGKVPPRKLTSPHSRLITDAEIIAELKYVASKLAKSVVTRSDFDYCSTKMSSSTVVTRFGSWKKGLTKALLELSLTARRYSEQECFENILQVWEYYGKQPTKEMMNRPPSKIRTGTYSHRWGSWFNALKAFITSANTSSIIDFSIPENQIECIVETKVRLETVATPNRSIGWRLRYQVLNRDNFKCVLCGNSPAIDNKCKLHVDHIFPFAKGGKTVISNLRTLCHVCNIGKGDTVLESI